MNKSTMEAIAKAGEQVRQHQCAKCAELPELERRLETERDEREREWLREAEIPAAKSACEECRKGE
jgi:hypothetical protein